MKRLSKKIRNYFTTHLIPSHLVNPFRQYSLLAREIFGWPTSYLRRGNVVMFHVGRCGSTVLGNMLDQNSKVCWEGEVLFNEYVFRGCQLDKFNEFDIKQFLFRRMLVAGRNFFGFEIKIHPEQQMAILRTSLSQLIEDLEEIGVQKYIILERKNYLRRMVSQLVGTKTKIRHISENSKSKLTKISPNWDEISFSLVHNPKSIVQCLQEICDVYSHAQRDLKNKNALWLTYEDDILPDPYIYCLSQSV